MSILSPPTTDFLDSYFTLLNEDSYSSSLSPSQKKFYTRGHCWEEYETQSQKDTIICPKCNRSAMEEYQIAPGQYMLICGDKVNSLDNHKNSQECVYPLDSENMAQFIGAEGEPIEELYERARSVCDLVKRKVLLEKHQEEDYELMS